RCDRTGHGSGRCAEDGGFTRCCRSAVERGGHAGAAGKSAAAAATL
ncbi:uncharacterized protein METZ01_LOCUS359190, partial [marine metagenome]